MANDVEKNLIKASADMVRTEVGAKFFLALQAYVGEVRDGLVEAPPHQLSHHQGQARALSALLAKIGNSVETAGKMVVAENNKPRAKP